MAHGNDATTGAGKQRSSSKLIRLFSALSAAALVVHSALNVMVADAFCARDTSFSIEGMAGLPTTNGKAYAGLEAEELFGYHPLNGPMVWPQLHNGVFATCGTGTRQSPIDISTNSSEVEENLKKLSRNKLSFYHDSFDIHFAKDDGNTTTYALENIGTTMEINHLKFQIHNNATGNTTSQESYTVVNGTKYEMKQIHFHSPSEHTIDGVGFPLEAHIVHESVSGNVPFVISLLYETNYNTSDVTDAFGEAFRKVPLISDQIGNITGVDFSTKRLTSLEKYIKQTWKWAYSGSFTTPPCSEGVNWLVTSKPIRVSVQDLNVMRDALARNNRFTQTKLGEENILNSVCGTTTADSTTTDSTTDSTADTSDDLLTGDLSDLDGLTDYSSDSEDTLAADSDDDTTTSSTGKTTGSGSAANAGAGAQVPMQNPAVDKTNAAVANHRTSESTGSGYASDAATGGASSSGRTSGGADSSASGATGSEAAPNVANVKANENSANVNFNWQG